MMGSWQKGELFLAYHQNVPLNLQASIIKQEALLWEQYLYIYGQSQYAKANNAISQFLKSFITGKKVILSQRDIFVTDNLAVLKYWGHPEKQLENNFQ